MDDQHLRHPAAMPQAEAALLSKESRWLIVAVFVIALGYFASAAIGWPQQATQQIVSQSADAKHAAELPEPPILLTVAPFILMLGAIASLPLIGLRSTGGKATCTSSISPSGLAVITVLYFALLHPHPIVGEFPAHHISHMEEGEGVHLGTVKDLLANAMLNEYVPFIVLLLSLYTISGGIRIEGDLRAHAVTNTVFLAIGGLLASFIGTTGAAMVLIRPLLETNRERKHVVAHRRHVSCSSSATAADVCCRWAIRHCSWVIFVVCRFCGRSTCGASGCSSTVRCWRFIFCGTIFTIGPTKQPATWFAKKARVHRLRFAGLGLNSLLLAGVVLAVAFLDPSKPLPGTAWHPWVYFREMVLLGLVAASLIFGSPHTRKMNNFNYGAIIEVAVLFFGIFICMQPALQILNARGAEIGLNNPYKFFWASGTLSSFLDNAPTYLVYFEAANAMTHEPGPGILQLLSGHYIREDLLTAISLGSVFMGAMTYIGNGPNFMVKSIAESWGVKMPSFFGYMVYSCCILLPLLVLLNILFL